jgi:hypothetical protein
MPKGILTPRFIEITPAVTKRALLTDDGRHVIAIAHQRWAKNVWLMFWKHDNQKLRKSKKFT